MSSFGFLAWVCFWPGALIFCHVVCCRFLKTGGSPQIFLIRLQALMNVPLVWGVVMRTRQAHEIFWALVFSLVVFNGFGYSYFQWFNMSETARRIRMLFLIRDGRATAADLEAAYSSARMADERIRRLLEMRQIVRGADWRYRVSGPFFVNVAKGVGLWRSLFGFEGF